MTRRITIKRPYTPDSGSVGGRFKPQAHSDSEGDEFIDVETVGSGQVRPAHFVDVITSAPDAPTETTIVRKMLPRTRQISSKLRSVLASIPSRTTPKITLIGRGRPESLNPALLHENRSQNTSEQPPGAGPATSSRRAPILANEGIGTYAISKLPLEEMTMSTRVLRAIQEDHTLAKIHCTEEEPEQLAVSEFSANKEVKSVDLITSEPSTSSEVPKATKQKKYNPANPIACPHLQCPSSFPCVDDLISHLVTSHCEHQFHPRKLTFISLDKYEVWKVAHEDMHHAKMVVDADKEEYAEGFARLQYHCEYYRVPVGESTSQQRNDGKSFHAMVTCPAYFNATIDFDKNTATIFGCLAHISHPKKTSAAVTSAPSSQKTRSKPSEVKCKYCGKWCSSRIAMNRHVKEEHTDPTFNKVTTIECGDPHCDVVCDRMSTLCEHVAREHGREDLVIEELRFNDITKFKEWKSEVESSTLSKFVLSSSRTRASGVTQSYYLCHLSGYANRSRHSAPPVGRLRTTKKLGRYCTAFMNTKEYEDGSVVVQCCLGHFGHGFDVRRLPLPDKVKKEVTDLLLKGVSTYDVYDTVRRRYTQNERGYYLQRYEIRNIADKLRKQGLLSPRDAEKSDNHFENMHSSSSSTKGSTPDVEKPQAHVPSVRFHSLRTLPEKLSCVEMRREAKSVYLRRRSDAKHGRQNQYNLPKNAPSTALSNNLGRLRDVSPPIIGTSGYAEFHETAGYEEEEEMLITGGDEDGAVTYFVHDTQHSGDLLEVVHTQQNRIDCVSPTLKTKVTPLLMEPQPTGNVTFDISMSDIRREIRILQDQKRQTKNAEKLNSIVNQIRDLQGQLVRGVPQTTGFIQTAEQEFDGEEEGEYEAVEGDDAVCFEVEVVSSEAPNKSGTPVTMDDYEDISFEAEPYEEVVAANYELV